MVIRTADSVIVFVDLGTVPVETVAAILDNGSRVDVNPFTMAQSHKQFAVIELPGGITTVTLEAIGADETVLDTADVIGGN